MDWTDDAVILSVRPFGESGAIADLLTREHGRHGGLVRGARSKTMRGLLQPGNGARAHWRGRLDEHLGTFTLEAARAYAGFALSDRARLAALNAACATALACMPERVPHPAVYESFALLLDLINDQEVWPALHVRWELGLLSELGYGLDLSKCAATGGTEDLIFVSPRSGRAVSREGGRDYADRLLPLPRFLLGSQAGGASPEEILNGFELTGHFLERHLLKPFRGQLPEARARYVELLRT